MAVQQLLCMHPLHVHHVPASDPCRKLQESGSLFSVLLEAKSAVATAACMVMHPAVAADLFNPTSDCQRTIPCLWFDLFG
jgi:hypothetical protein